jgi:glycosyltransferase involved in cell wall biosynthesis
LRILLVSTGPMPFDGFNRVYAMGVRTLHLLRLLLRRGHQVTLISIEALAGQTPSPFNQFELPDRLFLNSEQTRELQNWFPDTPLQGLTYYSLPAQRLQDHHLLAQISQEFSPESLIAIGSYAAFLATRVNLTIPMWADLCGSYMTEGQAKAATYNDDTFLDHFLKMETVILGHFDFFSAVSDAQKFAMVGELGLSKRLNRLNYGQDLVWTIPISSDSAPAARPESTKKIIRGIQCPEDAFILLWSGGFNTWTDIDTLFKGMNLAMESHPELYMIITGGQIEGHDELTFPRFQALVETSAYKDRFIFAGWVESADLGAYYTESDLGIILDKWSYEGLLGSRSRVLEWAGYELPVISTVTSQLLQELDAAGLLFSFKHEDSQALAAELGKVIRNRSNLPAIGQHLRCFVQEHYEAERVFQPLLAWAETPRRAGDSSYVNLNREKLGNKTAPELLNRAGPNGAALAEWAKHLQDEVAAKDYQINKLWRDYQHQMAEFERLSTWALSLEQQLLLHQSSGKPAH